MEKDEKETWITRKGGNKSWFKLIASASAMLVTFVDMNI
jgi:hypothetical protein